MSAAFSIGIGAASPVPVESLGFAVGGVELHNMQPDTARLRWTRARPSQACPLAHDDEVRLWFGGRCLLHGRARIAGITHEGCTVSLAGPMAWLDELTFQQGLSSAAGSDTGAPSTWTSSLWLFAPVGSSYRSVEQQLNDVLQYTLLTQPGLLEHGGPVGGVAGPVWDLGAPAAPKVRTVQDLTVADAVRQVLASKPDAAVWWGYGPGAPAFQARVATAETPLELAVGASPLIGYDLSPNDDMRPSAVLTRWESAASTVTGKATAIRTAERWPTDALTWQPRNLIQTVSENVPVVTGMSKEVFDALTVRRASGAVTVLDRDFALGLRPGCVLAISGDPLLSGLLVWVQSVSWAADTGIATCRAGYPAHLGLRERIDLRGWLRKSFYGPGADQVPQVTPS